MEPTNVLVIGDAHVDDEQDLRRFRHLSNYIIKHQPEYIVIIGDFLSLNCLSEWDRNKRMKMENRRYWKEIEAGNTALDLLEEQINVYNEAQTKANKKKRKPLYQPKKVYIEGNHEYRLPRYLDSDPVFAGVISIEEDLKLVKRGWGIVPYKEGYIINGVNFTHIPITGMGKALANPMVAQKALKLYATSVVFGHTHTLDHAAEHRHGAKHLNQALSVGCFFEHVDEYAVGSKTDYWRGVVSLNIYSENRFDVTTTSMSRLLKEY